MPTPKDKENFFTQKGYLSRPELRQKFSKSFDPRIPKQERVKMGQELFGREAGSYITKGEYKKTIKKLGAEKSKAKTSEELTEIKRKTSYLKRISGM
ncbi:hypothetical protein COS93_01235 [bacterium (Candidatus Gribaldobacteria) CG07_land_8_20_14_0_80_33_18]|uniref:Uncharacterized protein n=1 Tax=bacterium (Candidatus Gribaldobacteria) CG07_land_8_20_14_0_80_33_18 TaxID=2014272 RepID=A0A2M6Z3H9_9BACT|nr:MAG: hypothetical protein COS93_01235 [bacterium (Candidatus Gribaldobacteria) CG07_land_8_20_14_0_80_33_18]PJA00374.1 MAG: hypothetical protein COX75_02515 [bacterium (Candidatus Gribaldobacteria) CG_4_10_14_0_2_um_filter_33_15]PJB08970.1 MAG: hypothetical protein CO122_00570 [bacterium (Candidatus Gribaldobacteria) CG_4_9_14_3_um_filter_33_9]